MSQITGMTWDGEAREDRGYRMTVVIRYRGKRARKLRSTWRRDSVPQRAYYLGHMELQRRIADEERAAKVTA